MGEREADLAAFCKERGLPAPHSGMNGGEWAQAMFNVQATALREMLAPTPYDPFKIPSKKASAY